MALSWAPRSAVNWGILAARPHAGVAGAWRSTPDVARAWPFAPRTVATVALSFSLARSATARGRFRRKRGTVTATGRDVALRAAAAERPSVVLVIGGPGSGKGTQCERIAAELGYVHLSAGELLRAELTREGSTLCQVIQDAMLSGGVVPSAVIAELLEGAMRDRGWAGGRFIVDGYPRSVEQLQGWDEALAPLVDFRFALYLQVGREEMLKRLLRRAETSGRSDDNPATVEKRFVTFEAETSPLLEHFESRGLLQRVDGERGVDDVWEEIKRVFCVGDS